MTGGPELEELPPQRVLPRGRGRPGAAALVGISATAMLLAGGLGLLGGRPGPSPIGTWTTNASGAPSPLTAVDPTAAAVEPVVTPWVTCAPDPSNPPEVLFEVDGRVYRGDPDETVTGETGRPIRFPREATTALWVDGAVCALAWVIEVGGSHVQFQDNAEMIPSVAAQNRFRFLVPDTAGAQTLVATLSFNSYAIELRWSIQVDPYDIPYAELSLASQVGSGVAAEPGCDLTIRLANGYTSGPNDCGGSGIGPLPADLGVQRAKRSEPLAFNVSGLRLENGGVECGRLEPDPLINGNTIFVPDPTCVLAPQPVAGGIALDAPAMPGIWAIAVHACATNLPAGGGDESPICGTWYSKVEVA